MNGRFTRDEIDRRAAIVAAAALDGAVSAEHARRVVAALLYGSSIPESVAGAWNGERQTRVDIADRLRDLLFTKATQATAGGFRLDRVAEGASTSGWATQLCRAALPSAARDVRVRQREQPYPAVGDRQRDDAPPDSRTIAEIADWVAPAFPELAEGAVKAESAAEAGLSVVSGMRPGSRRHRGAVHLGRSLGVPVPVRPADATARRQIAAVLDRDPKAARRSVRAELARRRGPASDRVDVASDPLAALWTRYHLEALEILADRDPRFAHAVAAAAAAPRPAIRADVSVALAAHVRRAEPGNPAWGDLAGCLVGAFLAHICDLPSEFSPAHRSASPKSARRKTREAAAFAQLTRQAAGFPTAPLGSVPAMVEAELQDRLLLIEAVVADLRRRPAA